MESNALKPAYPHLPLLTPDEFDRLVEIARSHGKSGSIISDISVSMARAVLLEGKTYLEAVQLVGKTTRTSAQQAVAIILRNYMGRPVPVQPHNLFR